MNSTQPWLPPGALDPAHFERPIQALVDEWSSHWSKRAQASARPRLREAGIPATRPAVWQSIEGLCGVTYDEAGRLVLAEAMLGRPIAVNAVQPADRALLEDITSSCLDDLIVRIATLIGAGQARARKGDPLPAADSMIWDIGLKRSGASLTLAIHRSAMIGWRKRIAPAPAHPELKGIRQALQPQPVEIDVDLGRGSISLSDLESLAEGDVILLDRPADGPVPVRAAGIPIGLSGSISQDGSSAKITLIEPKKART